MTTWYSCKVKYGRQEEDGGLKQVTDEYLVDAVSYTDAEARVHHLGRELPGDFAVASIRKTNFAEVIPAEEAETWFKCKVTYHTVDGDRDKEVKITTYLLVCAHHIKQAFETLEAHFSGMIVAYEVPSVIQTNIVEVYPYDAEEIPSHLRPISEVENADYQ